MTPQDVLHESGLRFNLLLLRSTIKDLLSIIPTPTFCYYCLYYYSEYAAN